MSSLVSPLQPIHDLLFEKNEIEVSIKRDDLIHPYVMGNKWRKLKYNLEHAKKKGFTGMVTFGGAFSNHIAATAALCHENGLKSVGIIRGDELNPGSNPTLRFVNEQGMELRFVTRGEYRRLKQESDELMASFPDHYLLPEGGTNSLAIAGCEEIVKEFDQPFDYLALSIGTGGTMAGLLKGMSGRGMLMGYSSLKGNFVFKDFKQLIEKNDINFDNYRIINDFHFGGYGRVNDDLIRFINQTKQNTGLLFDPVYTAKMYFGVREMIKDNSFAPGSKIIIVHTGGLQGIAGYNKSHKEKIMV